MGNDTQLLAAHRFDCARVFGKRHILKRGKNLDPDAIDLEYEAEGREVLLNYTKQVKAYRFMARLNFLSDQGNGAIRHKLSERIALGRN